MLALLPWCANVRAHPVLTFTVASHIDPIKGVQAQKAPPQPSSDESYPLTVTLGHKYLSMEAKGTRTIYDFEHFRLYQLNLADRTFDEFSLYSNIGFRVLEFHNRLGIGKALGAGGVKTLKTETPLLEQLFSLLDDQSRTVIETKRSGGQTVYQWESHKFLSISDRVRQLAPGYQAEYWRFLRYFAGGHPRIYEALQPLAGVPEMTSIVLTNFNTETRSLSLHDLEVMPDQDFSLEGFSGAAPRQEPYLTLALVAPDAPQQLERRLLAARQDRDSAFSQGRYLDALLAFQEAFLSTGVADVEWLKSAKDRLNHDPNSMRLTGALANKDPLRAAAAAEALASLRTVATAHTDVIDLFEGNARLALNQGAQGTQLLLSAVKTNPYLTGVWHDLADFYYRSFEMQEAWACMDTARRIAPNHPMIRPFDGLEQSLRTRNPEFF
jgi:hypothetical protein